jgi:hypothetical protein
MLEELKRHQLLHRMGQSDKIWTEAPLPGS